MGVLGFENAEKQVDRCIMADISLFRYMVNTNACQEKCPCRNAFTGRRLGFLWEYEGPSPGKVVRKDAGCRTPEAGWPAGVRGLPMLGGSLYW